LVRIRFPVRFTLSVFRHASAVQVRDVMAEDTARKRAEQCMDLAREASNEADRSRWLVMAQFWFRQVTAQVDERERDAKPAPQIVVLD
jgi:hypothetical protein